MTNIVDDLIRESRRAAEDELRHMLDLIDIADMTPCELIGFVALLRPVVDRAFAASAPIAPVLRLVPPEAKSSLPAS